MSKGDQRALCLRTTCLYRGARRAWKQIAVQHLLVFHGRDDPQVRFVDVLLRNERALQQNKTEFVTGLWTAEHGFVHTGSLAFFLEDPRDDLIELQATGAYNVLDAPWEGPCAGFPSLQSHQEPVRVALPSWPF